MFPFIPFLVLSGLNFQTSKSTYGYFVDTLIYIILRWTSTWYYRETFTTIDKNSYETLSKSDGVLRYPKNNWSRKYKEVLFYLDKN